MVSAQLSVAQWHSSDYLSGLWHKEMVFGLPSAQQIELRTDASQDDKTLIVFCQAMNLEKLFDVQQSFTDVLHIEYFYPGNKSDSQFSFEASVKVMDHAALASTIESVAQKLQLELAVVKERPTLAKPGLLVMDMDSTVIGIECIDEIAKLAGVGQQVSQVTELAMQGKLDFAQSLIQRVNCLRGADASILHTVRQQLPINPGIGELLSQLKQANWKLAIASGGFTFFADYLLQRFELDFAVSNQLEVVDGKLTGRVTGEIVTAQTKADTVHQLSKTHQIELSQTIALGDGANDLLMMQAAGLGVAYHAKPVVRQQADVALRFSPAERLLAYLKFT